MSYVKEGIMVLKHLELVLAEEAIGTYFGKTPARNYLTRFLNRHRELVPKLSSNFQRWGLKYSDLAVI